MKYIDKHALENLTMKKIIDHPRAPSRIARDQIVETAIKHGLWGWMPVTRTDPQDQYHHAWPRAQHPQIDRVREQLRRWIPSSGFWVFSNPWR
jgi:hypothetical protein